MAAKNDYPGLSEKDLKALQSKTVMIVGLGGVGTYLSNLFARQGIKLRLVDKERIYEDDMSRLATFTSEDINKFKAKQIKQHFLNIDSTLKVRTFHEELTKDNTFLLEADVIIDCTNDLKVMELIHKNSKKQTLIQVKYGASTGMIYLRNTTLNPDKLKAKLEKIPSIKEEGVFTPSVLLASSIIASETYKLLLKKKHTPGLISFDSWSNKITIKK